MTSRLVDLRSARSAAPRRQIAHRAIAGYLAGYSGATLDAYRLERWPLADSVGTVRELPATSLEDGDRCGDS